MLTNKNSLLLAAIVTSWACVPAIAAKDNYKNFELPLVKSTVEGPGKLFVSEKITLRNKVSTKAPRVDSKKFLFARESFLAEKREEAIKLLRQQMDSGLNINRENMLLRLGQLYAEKYMELSYQETEVFTSKLMEFEKSGKKGAGPKPDNSRSKKYLADALKLFYELERKYPKHPKIDEILFFIGFVEMESGRSEKGARYLDKVITKHPKSRKFEEAVLYMADYYFDVKNNFKAALAKFEILTRRKDSALYSYAFYKTAWCRLNMMQGVRALRDMKQLVKELEGSNDPSKFNLREQAIRDLVTFYAEAGNIDEAMEFFTEVAGREKALQNLRLIADSMRSKARDAEAIRAYQRLVREEPNSKEALLIQLGIYESLNRSEKSGKAVEALVYALDNYGPKSDWAGDYSGDKTELQGMLKTLEGEGAKAAFFYHSAAQKGFNKVNYGYALTLYEALLRCYPEHPDKKKFHFFRAEVLYSQKKWLEAADSYMEASKITPKDKMTDEAVYNALLALDQLTAKVDKIERYSEEQQKTLDLSPREIPKGEERFIEIANLYMNEYPKGARIVDVQFRIAAIYYRYRHFDRALPLFEKIASDHPKHRSATTAAYIVLDVLNMQKKFDKLDEAAGRFGRIAGLGDAKFKSEMKVISSQIGFKQVEKLEADNKWVEAAEAYLRVYRSDPGSELAEKALYNALVSFEKGNEPGKSQELTKQFVAKYPKSKYAESLLLSMAKNAEKLYDFEESQKLYFDFYRNQPKSKEATKALYNSAVFAELLEKNSSAVERYNAYLKAAKPNAEERQAIQFSLAKLYRKQGNWDMYARIYRQLMADSGKLEDKFAYLGEMVRQNEIAGRTGPKNQLVGEMLGLYKNSGKNVKSIGPAARYIGEAAFNSVAAERKKYDETDIRFPVQDLVYLVGLKQRRLKNLGISYDKIIEVGVPEWGVAALHDKADAFAAYGATFRKVTIPAKMKGDDRKEAEIGLKKIETDIVVALEKQAEEIFKLCVDKATEFHVANEYAARCRSRMKSEKTVEPTGLMPLPSYWSMRPGDKGVNIEMAWIDGTLETGYEPDRSIAEDRVRQWEGSPPSMDDADKYMEYLSVLSAGGRTEIAETKTKEYLVAHPKEKRAVFLLATIYLRVKKQELAGYFFNQLEKDADFPWKSLLYNNLGMIALGERNRDAALDLFKKATEASPKIAAPLANLGAMYLQSKSYADAESLFKKAVELDSSFEDAALGLGVALEGQGKFDAAHEAYASYIDDNSRALSVLYNDSILLGNRLNQKEKAAQQMLRYIQNGGRESAKAQETMRNWR